ncbi:MAG: SsrA-binding protein SmpB [Ahrensia sp.]|nr:SsrA-binding protein SmpB [Ahrensia sp.]
MAPKPKAKAGDNGKTIAENRKARYNFAIEDDFEAGIVLHGTEVKALRTGKANIAESYVSYEDGELWLINGHIPEYLQGNRFNHEPRRRRKLLMSKREISRLSQAVARDGMTLVPLRLYFNGRGLAKLKIALAKGKKVHDKRQSERKRDWQREKGRLLREKG